MTIFRPITKSAFIVSFSKFGEFYFSEKDGGDVEAESSDHPNGSGNKIFKLVGPTKISNITLKSPFDPTLLGQIEPIILAFSCKGGNLVVKPVDCQGTIGTSPDTRDAPIIGLPAGLSVTPVGDPYIYTNARVIKYKPPSVDRKSADSAMIEIEFVVDDLTRGVLVADIAAAPSQSNVAAGAPKVPNIPTNASIALNA